LSRNEARARPRRWTAELIGLAALLVGLGEFALGRFWAQHLTPHIGWLCLGCAVLCGIARLWIAGTGWTVAAMILLLPVLPAYLPHAAAARTGCRVSVLTFNQLEENPDNAAAARLIGRLHPDILFAEKVYAPEELRRLLLAEFPGYSVAAERQLLILSRFPIGHSTDIRVGFWADARIAGREVRLLDFYMTRPNQDLAKYRSEYERLYGWLRDTRGPLILGGDGNTTAFSSEMRSVHAVLRDAWDEAGYGLGATFPGPWRRSGKLGPWMRIDYILHDGAFDAVSAKRVEDAAGAGHYPVMAELVFAGVGNPGTHCD
jgi:endonuclease/exonuclease/phosphatase (EEP) superfamily protein YafD